jgi:hypothetical protein
MPVTSCSIRIADTASRTPCKSAKSKGTDTRTNACCRPTPAEWYLRRLATLHRGW